MARFCIASYALGLYLTRSFVAWVGRNKLVINHLGKLFVTSDAATIIREIEVVHPAAKILVMASQSQEAEACSHRLRRSVHRVYI